MIAKRYRRIQVSLLIVMITSLVLIIILAFLQPASAVDQSGEVTGIVASAIEIEWETDADYCGGDNYNDVCLTTSISTPMDSGFGTVTASSNNPTGYFVTLQMRNDTNQNNLVPADVSVLRYIAPTPNTALSTVNTWGFYAGSTSSWLAVPRTIAPATNIISAASTSNKGTGPGTDQITVTFGVLTDATLPTTTTYANQVVFTAAANP